jgi:hypothetical protein
MALPHITNSKAGINKWDPMHVNMFEVSFTLPAALKADFPEEETQITEQVLSISGLGALHKTAGTNTQKFMGTTRTYILPGLDDTSAEIEIKFALNLKNETDNYLYRLIKAWARLGYNILTGEKVLKKDYCAEAFEVKIANRAGDVIEDVVFKDVMMADSPDGLNEYNYETLDAAELTVKFKSDWWTDVDAVPGNNASAE